MARAEDIWREKTDGEVLAAVSSLDDYTDEGRRIILAEADRRRLNTTALVNATASLRGQGTSSSSLCAYCGTTLLFAGKQEGESHFCSEECRQAGILLSVSNQVPDARVGERMQLIFSGPCPRCSGPGGLMFTRVIESSPR